MKPQTTVAEVSLIYRSRIKASESSHVKCSLDAYKHFKDRLNLDTLEYIEEFKVLLMNRSNAVLGILEVSKGGISGTATDVRVNIPGCNKRKRIGSHLHT